MAHQTIITDKIHDLPRGSDFQDRIEWTIRKSNNSGNPFFVLLVQIENLDNYNKRRPRYITLNLYKELYQAIRKAVHSSQFVGGFQNGFGLVFDAVDVGRVDQIGRSISAICMKVIRDGRYNDMTTRWTDIIQQFLLPNKPTLIYPKMGWSIYPRDGGNAIQVLKRALTHLKEMSR